VKEQEFVNTARRASFCGVYARETGWVAKLTPICASVEVAANSALFDTSVHLEEGPTIINVWVNRVAAETGVWL